jgi:hypothetical protein
MEDVVAMMAKEEGGNAPVWCRKATEIPGRWLAVVQEFLG